MIIDLHIHEKTYSLDSKMGLEEIINEAKNKGLDAICITDHESNEIKHKAREISKEMNYPVFVGFEFLTTDGDIVAFGIEDVPQEEMSAQEFIDLVESKGGVCISAHPYRKNNRGLEDKLKVVNKLNAIEVFNGSTDDLNNKKAFDVAKQLGIQGIGASDAHRIERVGKFATLFPFKVESIEDLIRGIKSNKCKPAIYKDGKYIIVEK